MITMRKTAQKQTAQTAGILQTARTVQRMQAGMLVPMQVPTQVKTQARTQARTPAKMRTILTTAQSSLERMSGRHLLGAA